MTNRVIKLRVWDKNLNHFLIEHGNHYGYDGHFYEATNILAGVYKNLIIQQFTTLLDKNDKEIYEGDIVKWTEQLEWQYGKYPTETYIGKVIWCAFGFDIKVGKRLKGFHNNHLCNDYRYEIIGNIFENPYLIK